MSDEPRVSVEDVQGELGFRVRWSVTDTWADVEVYEIIYVEEGDVDRPFFHAKDWVKSPDDATPNIDEAEPYLRGFVKWDGCTELDMGSPHWCGPHGYKKHITLLEYIFRRAHELMGREPEEAW